MHRRLLLAVVVVAAFASWGEPVWAAEPVRVLTVPPAAAGGELVGLYVAEGTGGVCLGLSRRSIEAADNCKPVPAFDQHAPFLLEDLELESGESVLAFGATRGEVAAVEYDVRGGRRVRLATEPAPPELGGGASGALRYFLGRLPADAYTRRLLASDGRVLDEQDDVGYGIETDRPATGPRVTVARDRGVVVSAAGHALLYPVRDDRGRRVPGTCTTVRSGHSRWRSCTTRHAGAAFVGYTSDCGPPRMAVAVDVPAGVGGVVLELGDGRRIAARPARVPGYPLSTYVSVVPATAAVRAVRLRVSGRERRMPVGIPPAATQCGSFGSGFGALPARELAAEAVVPLPGGHGVQLRDEGVDLCVGVDRLPTTRDCRPPAIYPDTAVLARSGRAFGGVVSADVVAVAVRLTGGRTITVPTMAPDGYNGPHADAIRVFAVTLPARAEPVDASALDAAGHRFELDAALGAFSYDPAMRTLPLGAVRGAAGAATVARGRLVVLNRLTRCLVVTRGALPDSAAGCDTVLETAPSYVVDCGARVAVLARLLHGRGATLAARLSDGSWERARIVRAGDDRIAVLSVPPSQAVSEVALRRRRDGRLADRRPLRLAAADAQCGYAGTLLGT